MKNLVRPATEDDLPAILELTKRNRALLAEFEPVYWRPAEKADVLHELFIRYLFASKPEVTKRVLERGGDVVGLTISHPQPSLWVIDDVCLAEDCDWSTDGVDLFNAIEERPAAMPAPHRDSPRLRAAFAAGLELVSTYRNIRLHGHRAARDAEPADPAAVELGEPPFHTLGPLMTSGTPLVATDGRAGYAVASPSTPGPPIYDAGGNAVVIDRVVSEDREALLLDVLGLAADRGDVVAILVVGSGDSELERVADKLGAGHPVDVLKWPGEGVSG